MLVLVFAFFPCLFTEEFEAIWYPHVAYYNARLMGDKMGIETRHTLEVIPNDNFTFLAENNMQIFKGSEHILSLTRESVIDWKCEYAYQWYPFDTQICRMEFVSTKYQTDVYLSRLTFNKNISLSRYSFSNIRMCKSSIDEMRAIIVEVTLGRPVMNNLLTVFVPTMLLVIISFTARFFAADFIDMVIQVNLTILLVIATM